MIANNATGEAIKQAFVQAGKTVEDAEREVPADRATVYRWRAGKHLKPDIVARLAEFLKSQEVIETYCKECPCRRVQLKKGRKEKLLRIVAGFRSRKNYLSPF